MAHIQTSGTKLDHANTTGTFTFAMPGNFVAGNSAVLSGTAIGGVANANITGVTIGGTAAVLVKVFNNTNNSAYWSNIWFVQTIGAAPGANVTITYGGLAASYFAGSVEEWAPFLASAADANASGERLDTSVTATLILTSGAKTQASEVVYASGMSSKQFTAGNVLTGPTGMGGTVTQTSVQNVAGTDIGVAAGYCEVNAAGTESATWTITTGGVSNEIDGVLATFKKTAAVVATTPKSRLGLGIGIGV